MSPAAFLLRLFLAVVLIANGSGAPPAVAAVPAPTADSAAPPCHGAAQDEVAAGAHAAPSGVPMDCCDERGACACIHACPGLPIAAAVIAGVPVHDAAPAGTPPQYRFEPPGRLHRPPIG